MRNLTGAEQFDGFQCQAGAYPPGINLFGYIKAETGLGQGARLFAHAVRARDKPYVILNFLHEDSSNQTDQEFDEHIVKVTHL